MRRTKANYWKSICIKSNIFFSKFVSAILSGVVGVAAAVQGGVSHPAPNAEAALFGHIPYIKKDIIGIVARHGAKTLCIHLTPLGAAETNVMREHHR